MKRWNGGRGRPGEGRLLELLALATLGFIAVSMFPPSSLSASPLVSLPTKTLSSRVFSRLRHQQQPRIPFCSDVNGKSGSYRQRRREVFSSAQDWERRAKSRDAKKVKQRHSGSNKPRTVVSSVKPSSLTSKRRPATVSSRPQISRDKRQTETQQDMQRVMQNIENYEEEKRLSQGQPGQRRRDRGSRGRVSSIERQEIKSKMTAGADGKVTNEDVDARSLETLEFQAITESLMQRCKTYRGQGLALDCLKNGAKTAEKARHLYEPVAEVMRLGGENAVPIVNGMHMEEELQKVRDRFPLELEELVTVGEALHGLGMLQDWLYQTAKYSDVPIPAVMEVAKDVKIDPSLRELFDGAFDGEKLSGIKFPQLAALQRQIAESERSIQKTMEGLSKSQEFDGMLENESVDKINGRFVLCVKPNFKRRVGIAHDSSRSGKSLFIEPFQVIEATNEMAEAGRKLKQEESRILTEMQGMLLNHSKALDAALTGAAQVDLLRAKAALSQSMGGGIIPDIRNEGTVDIQSLRHPLLALRGVHVVPNDVRLNSSFPGLVITGPNAGGKTIILKALGLYALMTRCGMPLPCGENTRVDIFNTVVASIGDSQTALGDLSTFSGHLSVWGNALERAGTDSLFLMDEMGTGTDPTQGAALAQAMLEAYAEEGARLVVTTHYPEIKQFAAKDERFLVSGMMLVNGRPTYEMTPGFASESHAIAMAERLKMPEYIVERAKSLIDDNTREMLNLMEELQNARDRAQTREKELVAQKKRLRLLEEQVETKTKEIEDTRKTVRAEAATQYAGELKAKEKRLNTLLKDLQKLQKQSQSAGENNDGVMLVGDDINNLRVLQKEVESVKTEVREASRPKLMEMGLTPLTEGDRVGPGDLLAVIDGGTFDKRIGEVQKVRGNKVDITITRGRVPFKMTLSRSDLAWPSDDRIDKEEMMRGNIRSSTSATSGMGNVFLSAMSTSTKKKEAHKRGPRDSMPEAVLKGIRMPENTIDVRGMSLPEAKETVITFLAEKAAKRVRVAYIAHGQGMNERKGSLKDGIRNWLASGKVAVVTTHDAAAVEDGGDAYTIVGLKTS